MTPFRNIFILIPFVLALFGCASQQKLMDSVKERELDVTRDMVEAGMNPYVENEHGVSPFEVGLRAEEASPTRQWAEDLMKESSKRAQLLGIDIVSSEMTSEELAMELAKKDFYIDAPLETKAPSLLHNLAQMENLAFTDHAIELIKAGADVNRQVTTDDGSYDASNTPLIAAAFNGNTRLIKALLDAGADPSATESDGNTAAHVAVLVAALRPELRQPSKRIVELLADGGVDLEITNDKDFTVFASAVVFGDLELAKNLLRHGADPNVRIGENKDSILRKVIMLSPSDSAALSEKPEIVQFLLDNGASVNDANKKGFTSLSLAVSENQLEVAKLLIENGASVDYRDKAGRTHLFHATAANSNSGFESAELLIENGADVDARDKDGWTALFTSVREKNLSAIKALITMGADPNIATGTDNDNMAGWTPLMYAVYRGNATAVTQLIEAGADVGRKDSSGWTALMFTANTPENGNRENDAEIVRILVDAGSNVDAFNDDLVTPLYKATDFQRTEVLKALLKAGANPSLRNTDGEWTALHAAGFSSDTPEERLKDAQIGRILLENGAELERRNVFDYTPLHIAAANGHVELLEVLLEAGANIYATDRENRTPLDLAKEDKQARIVAEIREAQSSSNPL